MKLKDRIKTYNFWVSLISALFLIINIIGQKFNFHIDELLFNDLLTSLCGILVLLGIIAPPTSPKPDKIQNPNFEDESSTKKDDTNFLEKDDETKFVAETNSANEKPKTEQSETIYNAKEGNESSFNAEDEKTNDDFITEPVSTFCDETQENMSENNNEFIFISTEPVNETKPHENLTESYEVKPTDVKI